MDEVAGAARAAQGGKTFRWQAEAEKPLVTNVAEPAPYPLLRRIVVLSLNESANQTRPGFSASGRTFRDALLRTFHGRGRLLLSEQGPQIFVAARYDIVTAGENWVTVVASGVPVGLSGSRKSAMLYATSQLLSWNLI